MGVDSFTIHTDGVIERGNELETVLLNILEVGSHRMSPLAAYKAQRKCFKIAKNEREIDFKEYVERLQLDHYPVEFKKAEYGRRIVVLSYLIIPFLLMGIFFFGMGIEWGRDGLEFRLFGILFIILSSLGIWRVVNLVKRIKKSDDN